MIDSAVGAVDNNGDRDSPSPWISSGIVSSALCMVVLVVTVGNVRLSVLVTSVDG